MKIVVFSRHVFSFKKVSFWSPKWRQNGSPERPRMGPVTEPCRKTLVRNDCVLIAFFRCQKNAKNTKKTWFWEPHFSPFSPLWAYFFELFFDTGFREAPGAPREAPGTPPGPLRDRFFNDFGLIFWGIFGTYFSSRLLFFKTFFDYSNKFPDGYSTQARDRNTD